MGGTWRWSHSRNGRFLDGGGVFLGTRIAMKILHCIPGSAEISGMRSVMQQQKTSRMWLWRLFLRTWKGPIWMCIKRSKRIKGTKASRYYQILHVELEPEQRNETDETARRLDLRRVSFFITTFAKQQIKDPKSIFNIAPRSILNMLHK